MSIRITQKCDSCGKVRRLQDVSMRDHHWKQVKTSKDICTDCINGLLTPKEEEKTDG